MLYHFADCTLDDENFTLTRGGEVQSVEPQVIDLLIFMVQNDGVLISKDELIDKVWAGRIVSDSAISARIAAARRAVGDDGKIQSCIQTVSRRGFQFVADVSKGNETTGHSKQHQIQPTIRYATADDGVKIAFAVSGNGPPLVRLAHHPTHLELDWSEPAARRLFDSIGETHTLIRIDQRGCGLSDLNVYDFSTDRSAKSLMH